MFTRPFYHEIVTASVSRWFHHILRTSIVVAFITVYAQLSAAEPSVVFKPPAKFVQVRAILMNPDVSFYAPPSEIQLARLGCVYNVTNPVAIAKLMQTIEIRALPIETASLIAMRNVIYFSDRKGKTWQLTIGYDQTGTKGIYRDSDSAEPRALSLDGKLTDELWNWRLETGAKSENMKSGSQNC